MKLRSSILASTLIFVRLATLQGQGIARINYEPYAFTTLAGNATNGDPVGVGGAYADGTGSAARFFRPIGVAADSAGNVYVADTRNKMIRKITPAGVVTTHAGLLHHQGSSDGTRSEAWFDHPNSVAVDGLGTVYVGDNCTIREITPEGRVATLAGRPGVKGSEDGTGREARFSTPSGVAVDRAGNVYVADQYNHTIRKMTPALVVTTLAGLAGSQGSEDGTGSAARFQRPVGVAVDSSNNVYVVELENNTVRKVTSAGVVTTLAGSARQHGHVDGTGSAARFYFPEGVAVDAAGNVYVADNRNQVIRKVTPAGVVTTLAGGGFRGGMGSTDGTGSTVRFYFPYGVAVDNKGNLYVADYNNNTIRKGYKSP